MGTRIVSARVEKEGVALGSLQLEFILLLLPCLHLLSRNGIAGAGVGVGSILGNGGGFRDDDSFVLVGAGFVASLLLLWEMARGGRRWGAFGIAFCRHAGFGG